MARLQVLPLTPIRNGEIETTPFILVVDQLKEHERADIDVDVLRSVSGAQTVFVGVETIDVVAPLALTDAQQAELISRLDLGTP